jgi:hypothetical protein
MYMHEAGRWGLGLVAAAIVACGYGIEGTPSGPDRREDAGEVTDLDDASSATPPDPGRGDGGSGVDASPAPDASATTCTAPDDCAGAAVCLDGGCAACGAADTMGLACKDGRTCGDAGCR